MRDKDDGTFGRLTDPSVGCQFGDEMLGMVMYFILRDAVGK